jgi:hypothetical protein
MLFMYIPSELFILLLSEFLLPAFSDDKNLDVFFILMDLDSVT